MSNTLPIISIAVSATAAVISAGSVRRAKKSYELAARKADHDRTEAVFTRWWSPEMQRERRLFFREFIPRYWPSAVEMHLKELNQLADGKPDAEEVLASVGNLVYFFDRVGWLGALQLIDVDLVLGPMQHVVRRAYWVTHEMIERDATLQLVSDGPLRMLDPVYNLGFRWLYHRTEKRPQVSAVRRVVGRRAARPLGLKAMADSVKEDERAFQGALRNLRAGEPWRYTSLSQDA